MDAQILAPNPPLRGTTASILNQQIAAVWSHSARRWLFDSACSPLSASFAVDDQHNSARLYQADRKLRGLEAIVAEEQFA